MFKKGEFLPKKISGQNVQKFNLSAGARGARIREGPQCPSYATDTFTKGFRGKLVRSKFVTPQFHSRKISRICSWRSIPVVIYGSESPAPSPAGFRDTGIFGD